MKLVCPVCGTETDFLTTRHIQKHGWGTASIREKISAGVSKAHSEGRLNVKVAKKILAKRDALNAYALARGMNSNWVDEFSLFGMEMQVGLRPWITDGSRWMDPLNKDTFPPPGHCNGTPLDYVYSPNELSRL